MNMYYCIFRVTNPIHYIPTDLDLSQVGFVSGFRGSECRNFAKRFLEGLLENGSSKSNSTDPYGVGSATLGVSVYVFSENLPNFCNAGTVFLPTGSYLVFVAP
jgi:hypothetical protein